MLVIVLLIRYILFLFLYNLYSPQTSNLNLRIVHLKWPLPGNSNLLRRQFPTDFELRQESLQNTRMGDNEGLKLKSASLVMYLSLRKYVITLVQMDQDLFSMSRDETKFDKLPLLHVVPREIANKQDVLKVQYMLFSYSFD